MPGVLQGCSSRALLYLPDGSQSPVSLCPVCSLWMHSDLCLQPRFPFGWFKSHPLLPASLEHVSRGGGLSKGVTKQTYQGGGSELTEPVSGQAHRRALPLLMPGWQMKGPGMDPQIQTVSSAASCQERRTQQGKQSLTLLTALTELRFDLTHHRWCESWACRLNDTHWLLF